MRHRFTYLTARFTAASKSGAKTQVQYVNPGTFNYVDIGTYCSVFITLLQVHIAMVQNSNIRGLSLKANALSCRTTPNPTLNLPHSVNKCTTDITTYFFAISSSFADLNCFVEPCFHRIQTAAPRLLSTSPYRTNLPSIKTHRYEAGYVRC